MNPILSAELLNIGRITFVVVAFTTLFVFTLLMVDQQKNRDLSDETGVRNFKRYDLAFAITLVLTFIIGFILFVAFN